MPDKLTVCIPAYNESEAIEGVLRALSEQCPDAEIIIVDDGSTDSTAEVASRVEGITVISHTSNRGYGGALKTAMRSASGDAVAWYDSDGQHRPEDLINVSRKVLDGTYDMVIGVRESDSDVVLERVPGKWVLRKIAEMVVGERVPDLNSGLRCFRRELIMKYLHILPDTFSASSTSTLLMMKRGYRIGYETIRTEERTGKSSVKMLRDGWRTLQLIMRILILFEALSVFALLGALQVIPGFVYGVWIAVSAGRGVPVLGATVLLSGLITFFMGLICDQVVELRKEKFE